MVWPNLCNKQGQIPAMKKLYSIFLYIFLIKTNYISRCVYTFVRPKVADNLSPVYIQNLNIY